MKTKYFIIDKKNKTDLIDFFKNNNLKKALKKKNSSLFKRNRK